MAGYALASGLAPNHRIPDTAGAQASFAKWQLIEKGRQEAVAARERHISVIEHKVAYAGSVATGLACKGRCEEDVGALIGLIAHNIRSASYYAKMLDKAHSNRYFASVYYFIFGLLFLGFAFFNYFQSGFESIDIFLGGMQQVYIENAVSIKKIKVLESYPINEELLWNLKAGK